MRIEIFSDAYLPGVGGSEIAVSNLALALNCEHEVAVACPKYKEEPEDLGFPVFTCRSVFVKKPSNYCAFSVFDKKFRKKIEDFKPDVIVTHSVNDMLSRAIKLAKKINVPIIATVHTKFHKCWLQDTKSHLITACLLSNMKKLLKKVDLITTVSNDVKQILLSYNLGVPIVVIKNGCRIERCQNVQELVEKFNKNYHFDPNVFTFLYVGRLDKIKNIDFTFEMLKKLKDAQKEFRFLIVGSGNYKKYYVERAKKLGIDDRVWFLGELKDRNLDIAYARGDLMLFPSLFDTDGLVVCEAACFKTPTLAVENTGPSERLSHNKTGFVIKNDLQNYYETVLSIMENKKLLEEVSQNAYDNLPQSWGEIAKQYLKVYAEEIKRKKQKSN